MYAVRIICVTGDAATEWCSQGADRLIAEHWYHLAMRSGKYMKPLYRVIVRPKPKS